MSFSPAQLRTVGGTDLPDYPISAEVRLDAHFFLAWNLKRWRASDFRRRCDPEVGWYGLQLFFLAQDGSPIGTLPCDDALLAFDLNVTVEQWQTLCRREVSPLWGWYPVRCDSGEIRFAHKVVTEVALEAVEGKRRNTAKNADERMRKRLGTIADRLRRDIPGAGRFAGDNEMLTAISDWIDQRYEGGSATVHRIREALNALSSRP